MGKVLLALGTMASQNLGLAFSLMALGMVVELAFRRFTQIPSPTLENRVFNCKCVAVIVIFQSTVELILFIPIYGVAMTLARLLHGPLFAARPGILFALAIALLSSIAGDFIFYWYHRSAHAISWLWPIHKLHHEDEHMNVTTALRVHWMDSIADRMTHVLPAMFLPSPVTTVPLLFAIGYVHAMFEHLAIPIHLGPLNRVITNPANHRIHHSNLAEHYNKNFASVWPFWDVLFGTYHAPRVGEYPPTGLLSGRPSKNLREALLGIRDS